MMTTEGRRIASTAEPLAAAADASVRTIGVATDLNGLPSLGLSPGQSLMSAGPPSTVRFAEGQDGLELSADNQIEGVELITDVNRRALFNDNWGTVDRWTADDKITSYGASGIGFVNFGIIDLLQVNATIETFGRGSRGFNVYTGTVRSAEFDRIITHADGAVGIQISQPVGQITVRRGIETAGSTGDSLVKGVVVGLSATALSVKAGGPARKIVIAGGLITRGAGVHPLELDGAVDSLQITEGFAAVGGGFENI